MTSHHASHVFAPRRCVQQLVEFLELELSNRVAAKCGRTRTLDAVGATWGAWMEGREG